MKSSSNSKSDVDFVMRRRFVRRTSSVRCFMFVVIADIACHSLTSQTDLSLMSTVVLQSECFSLYSSRLSWDQAVPGCSYNSGYDVTEAVQSVRDKA